MSQLREANYFEEKKLASMECDHDRTSTRIKDLRRNINTKTKVHAEDCQGYRDELDQFENIIESKEVRNNALEKELK